AARALLERPRAPHQLSRPGPICFAILRSRSPATLNVHARTPRIAGSLGPRLARNLAQGSAGVSVLRGQAEALRRLGRGIELDEDGGLAPDHPGVVARLDHHHLRRRELER